MILNGSDLETLNATPAAETIDIGELHDQTFKILQALELIGTLVQTEIDKENLSSVANYEHEAFLSNVQFLASTFADMASHVLDNLPAVEA